MAEPSSTAMMALRARWTDKAIVVRGDRHVRRGLGWKVRPIARLSIAPLMRSSWRTSPARFATWNAGAEATFGHVAREAVGQSLDLIIPAAQRIRHWDGYRRVMETGMTRYAESVLAVPALHRDGR